MTRSRHLQKIQERLESLEPIIEHAAIPPLEIVEQVQILRAVVTARGNYEEAARQLGIGRATIYRRLAMILDTEIED